MARFHYKLRAIVGACGRVLALAARMIPSKAVDLRHPICQFMTAAPHSIGRDQTLASALERMRALRVRHLPVLEGGKLVGVLSQRDALLVETLRDVDPMDVTVEEAMSCGDIYAVAPTTPLAEVATAMAEHRYGCAIVTEGQHVVGIFTTVDALRAVIAIAEGAKGKGAP